MSNANKILQQLRLMFTELTELTVDPKIKDVLSELTKANDALLQTPINFAKPEYVGNIFGNYYSSLSNLLQIQFDSLAYKLRRLHHLSPEAIEYGNEVKELLQAFV